MSIQHMQHFQEKFVEH